MAGVTCATCKHFHQIQHPQGAATVCKRYPPTAFGSFVPTSEGLQMATNSVWPQVSAGEVCGEHQMAIVLSS